MSVSERDLRAVVTVHTREFCRACGTCLRENTHQEVQMVTRAVEDVAAIDQWLEESATAHGLVVQRHADEKGGLFLWRATSPALEWPVLVRYQSGEAGHVILTTICEARASEAFESPGAVQRVCEAHGLQSDSERAPEPGAVTPAQWWGATACLLTWALSPSLFGTTAARLVNATRESLSQLQGASI